MRDLIIPPPVIDEMIAHCREVYPNEACGMLAGRDGSVSKLYRITNAVHSPVTYEMESKEQFQAHRDMREQGIAMVAIYHSHPSTVAYPSRTDISRSLWDGEPIFNDVAYVIVSLADERPVIRAFLIDGDGVKEIGIISGA
ncbi:MAG TPA: M67 family metallopeptidase [Dissulfurispiraceae bacterium]|nr:M67 family metallopeptidase [Dissulfurispiraceae bacterium]